MTTGMALTVGDADDILRSLRPRMRRARRRLVAKVLLVGATPIALGALVVSAGRDDADLRVTTASDAVTTPSPITTSSTLVGSPSTTSASDTTVSTATTAPVTTAPVSTVPITAPPVTTAPNTTTPNTTTPDTTVPITAPPVTTRPVIRDPYAGAPACATHDPRAWHGLWNAALGCHYDHEHKDDPRRLDALFGREIYTFAGGEVGVPWRAPGDRSDQRGTGWLVRANAGCVNAFGTGCLTDLRVQVNAVFSGPGTLERYRSSYVEARGCLKSNPTRCGIVRLGGWVDSGGLWVDDRLVPLPNQPTDKTGQARNHSSINGYATWFGRNGLFDVAVITPSAWGPVNRSDPAQLQTTCTASAMACANNGSRIGLHILAFTVPESLDPDRDGFVTWRGFADVSGALAPSCTAASATCVPIAYEAIPVGQYQYRDDAHGLGDDNGGRSYDSSPSGEKWISYPN